MKKDKHEVDYSRGMGATRCRNCKFYQAGGYCLKVRGDIHPEYWCKLFQRR